MVGASTGDTEDIGECEDGRDGSAGRGWGTGRRTRGRTMPVSGVDAAEAQLELDWVAERFDSGEAMTEPTGVEMGWSSGMSSNSCLGLASRSR